MLNKKFSSACQHISYIIPAHFSALLLQKFSSFKNCEFSSFSTILTKFQHISYKNSAHLSTYCWHKVHTSRILHNSCIILALREKQRNSPFSAHFFHQFSTFLTKTQHFFQHIPYINLTLQKFSTIPT